MHLDVSRIHKVSMNEQVDIATGYDFFAYLTFNKKSSNIYMNSSLEGIMSCHK